MQTEGQSLPYTKDLLDLANQLFTVTKDVWNLTQKGHFRRVVEKLTKREILIHQLKAMEKQLNRERKVRKVHAESVMTHERLALEEAVGTIHEVLRKVSKVDAEIQHCLQHEKERIDAEMESIGTQQKLFATYSLSSGGPPQYFNLKI